MKVLLNDRFAESFISHQVHFLKRRSPRIVVANVLDDNIIVSYFEFQSNY